MHKIKSVKLWLTVILISIVATFTYYDKVTGEQFVEFVQWALAVFVLGNVGSKMTK